MRSDLTLYTRVGCLLAGAGLAAFSPDENLLHGARRLAENLNLVFVSVRAVVEEAERLLYGSTTGQQVGEAADSSTIEGFNSKVLSPATEGRLSTCGATAVAWTGTHLPYPSSSPELVGVQPRRDTSPHVGGHQPLGLVLLHLSQVLLHGRRTS